MSKAVGLSEQRLGRRNIFSPEAKIVLMVLKAYTSFSDRQLVEHLNGNIHYQMFCGIMVNSSFPITNYKIVDVCAKVDNRQIDGISFIEHLSFKAFNEGIRLRDCIRMQQKLMNVRVRCWIFFGIHTANAVLMIDKIRN